MSMDTPGVVILAAGMGIRLREVSNGIPKAVVVVAGKPLIERALLFANALSPGGPRYVVGGFGYPMLRDLCERLSNVSPHLLVENQQYTLGNLFSVLTALPLLDQDFYLLNADHIFQSSDADKFRPNSPDRITAFVDLHRSLGDDDMKIFCDGTLSVKQISKKLQRFEYGYIGVTFVPVGRIEAYRAASRDVSEADPETATAEKVLQFLADHGETISCQVIDPLVWYEVDTPMDFEAAERGLSQTGGDRSLSPHSGS